MLIAAVAAFFKHKAVGSVLILACWPFPEKVKFLRELSGYNIRATFTCNPDALDKVNRQLQGVLYLYQHENLLLKKVNVNHYAIWYKWLVIADHVPPDLNNIRFDADITLLNLNHDKQNSTAFGITADNGSTNNFFYGTNIKRTDLNKGQLIFKDVYIHMKAEATVHDWAIWTTADGLQLKYENGRLIRRRNLQQYPLRISTPTGHFADSEYNGTFEEYLLDSNTRPDLDASIRCSFCAAVLLSEALNASHVLNATLIWATMTDNRSMLVTVAEGRAELGSILRPLHHRMKVLDFIMPLWPFSVGFTYLAERENSSNMFVEPFSAGVWWSCLVTGLILALVQRLTARAPAEKDGAINAVLATFLQQDASAVPEGISGRWTFMVLSIWAMLLYAYYTSAIVSSLMSAGRSGPGSLRALADSRYAIASEDYDYMRFNMFDRNSNSTELEYLKKKKMTADLYQTMQRGVELVIEGNTAFHSEYNQIYRHLNEFTDEQICKLSYVDTIPETLAWIVATKRSQFSDVFRSRSARIHETGLAKQLLSKWLSKPSPCRATLLAERVQFGDVALLLGITTLGVALAWGILAMEIFINKLQKKNAKRRESSIA